MKLIDTHCHLTDLYDSELRRQLSDARDYGVIGCVCIGGSRGIEASYQAVDLASKYANIWAAVGIHPHDAGDYTSLEQLESLCAHERVVAIGETGLDYFKDWSPFDSQKALFSNTIAVALNVHKPLVIHCREAAEDTITILKQSKAELVGGVFHCYAQTVDFAKKIFDMNFIVSFAGNLTFKKADNLRAVAKEIPLSHLMLETDAPYMSPEPFRGKPSEPKHVFQVAQKIAHVKDCSLEEVSIATTENAVKLFGLQL